MTDVKYIQLLVADFQTQRLPQTENAKKAVYLDDLEKHEFGLVQSKLRMTWLLSRLIAAIRKMSIT